MSDGTVQPDFLGRLEAMRTRGLEQQLTLSRRLSALEDQLTGIVPPEPLTATVALDDRGFPARVEIETAEGTFSPEQLRAALSNAFLTARALRPTLPVEAAEPLVRVLQALTDDPEDAAHRIEREGARVSNDLGQVHVTALFGDVMTVDAKDAWLLNTPLDDIAAEVLQVAQRAAAASDRFGRFTEENSDG